MFCSSKVHREGPLADSLIQVMGAARLDIGPVIVEADVSDTDLAAKR
jgi:hypothetical protein